jgi:hypothetical protein
MSHFEMEHHGIINNIGSSIDTFNLILIKHKEDLWFVDWGLSNNACQTFYNLQALDDKQNYTTYHIWNSNEIEVQVSKQEKCKNGN